MKSSKILFSYLLSVILLLSITACISPNQIANSHSGNLIKKYQDIPGITQDEINAIEAFKAQNRIFTYGMLDSTEAFLSENGERDGFAKLFSKFLSEMLELEINLEIYGWSELISGLEDKSIDFTGETTPTDVRQGLRDELFEVDGELVPGKEYIMSRPIAERVLRIFFDPDSNIRNELDIIDKKIGFLQGTTTPSEIRQAYRIDFDEIEIIVPDDIEELDDYDIAAQMLTSGEIFAFIDEATADPVFDIYNEERETVRSMVMFPMIHSPVSLTTTNPELAPIISVLNKFIQSGGADYLYELYVEGDFRYAKHKLSHTFTPAEKAYIADFAGKGLSVPVAYEHDNYPLNFYNDKDGRFEGIAVDILDEVEKLVGISFAPTLSIDVTFAEIYEKLMSGEVAMCANLLKTEDRIDRFIWSNVPYNSNNYALMSRNNYPFLAIHQVPRVKVGALKSSGYVDIYREIYNTAENLFLYDTRFECLNALERGEIDLLMSSEYYLLTQTNYLEKSNLKINIKLNAQSESYFGFNKDNEILSSIINKTLPYIDMELYVTSWTGRQFDYSKKLAEQQRFYMMLFIVFMALAMLAMGLVLAKNIKLSKKLEEAANHDALTGIYNRRHFMDLAQLHVAKAERTNHDCYIIIFDIDHFKYTNDTFGHLAGDKVLQEIAKRVRKAIRPYDIFGRYGGEEFVILLSGLEELNKMNAIQAAERIRLEICNEPVDYEGMKIAVSASFGIAYAAPKNNLKMATKYADEALYTAKESGRNAVIFYE